MESRPEHKTFTFILITVFLGSFVKGDTSNNTITVDPRRPVADHGFQLHVKCQPRPVILDIAPIYRNIHPRNIELFHCGGTDGLTMNQKCVPIKKTRIDVKFQEGSFVADPSFTKVQTFYNHTACGMRCVCRKNGFCENTLDVVETNWCLPHHTWNINTCECEPQTGMEQKKGNDPQDYTGPLLKGQEATFQQPKGMKMINLH